MKRSIKYHVVLSIMLLLPTGMTLSIYAQDDETKALELKRNALKREIQNIKKFLENTKKKEVDLSTQVRTLNQKIFTREALIKNIQQELKQLQTALNKNEKELEVLEQQLAVLKEDYAKMVYQSYKHKISENQLLFLLSSESFYQGYLRLQYLKQYTAYRKQQGEEIKDKSKKLEEVNKQVLAKKKSKEHLMTEMEQEQDEMKEEQEQQQALADQYKEKKKDYQQQITAMQEEESRLTAQIERTIRKAIKKTSRSNKTFKLAPEAERLAKDFESNKGKLPWPVDSGLVTVKFGTQSDPLDPGLKIESSGIRIATEENASVKTIFKGQVIAIQKNPQNGVLSVLIQHGNYISVYANLKHVVVTKGQTLNLEETIGIVYTNPIDGKTILKFQIWKDINKQNPSVWLKAM